MFGSSPKQRSLDWHNPQLGLFKRTGEVTEDRQDKVAQRAEKGKLEKARKSNREKCWALILSGNQSTSPEMNQRETVREKTIGGSQASKVLKLFDIRRKCGSEVEPTLLGIRAENYSLKWRVLPEYYPLQIGRITKITDGNPSGLFRPNLANLHAFLSTIPKRLSQLQFIFQDFENRIIKTPKGLSLNHSKKGSLRFPVLISNLKAHAGTLERTFSFSKLAKIWQRVWGGSHCKW